VARPLPRTKVGLARKAAAACATMAVSGAVHELIFAYIAPIPPTGKWMAFFTLQVGARGGLGVPSPTVHSCGQALLLVLPLMSGWRLPCSAVAACWDHDMDATAGSRQAQTCHRHPQVHTYSHQLPHPLQGPLMLLENQVVLKAAARRGLQLPRVLSTLVTAAVMLPITSLLFFPPVEQHTDVGPRMAAAVAANVRQMLGPVQSLRLNLPVMLSG
jgi:hypothetical protein